MLHAFFSNFAGNDFLSSKFAGNDFWAIIRHLWYWRHHYCTIITDTVSFFSPRKLRLYKFIKMFMCTNSTYSTYLLVLSKMCEFNSPAENQGNTVYTSCLEWLFKGSVTSACFAKKWLPGLLLAALMVGLKPTTLPCFLRDASWMHSRRISDTPVHYLGTELYRICKRYGVLQYTDLPLEP